MKSKLVYLLLLIICILFFSYSSNTTYAYLTDSTATKTSLQLEKANLTIPKQTVTVQTLNETQLVTVTASSQQALYSKLMIQTESLTLSDYVSITVIKNFQADRSNTQFTAQLAVKKIKEFPASFPKTLLLALPVVLDDTLNITIATLSLQITNQEDTMSSWPKEEEFNHKDYTLSNTLYYVKNSSYFMLNQPTLYIAYSGNVSFKNQAELDAVFKDKVSIGNSVLLDIQTTYVPKKGFKIKLLDFKNQPNTSLAAEIHVGHTNYTPGGITFSNSNTAVRQFFLATDFNLYNLTEKPDVTIQTNMQASFIPFSATIYNNDLTEVDLNDLNPALQWSLSNETDFKLSSVTNTGITLQQNGTQAGKVATLNLINAKTKQIYFTRPLVSTTLDTQIKDKASRAPYSETYSTSTKKVELRTNKNDIVYRNGYYELPFYINVTQNPLNESTSFTLETTLNKTKPVYSTRSADGKWLSFMIYLTPEQATGDGFNFSFYSASSIQESNRVISSAYFSFSSIGFKTSNTTQKQMRTAQVMTEDDHNTISKEETNSVTSSTTIETTTQTVPTETTSQTATSDKNIPSSIIETPSETTTIDSRSQQK